MVQIKSSSRQSSKDNPNSYESDLNEEVRTLIDLYYESDEPSKGHRDFFFDIETAKDENGYSTIEAVRTQLHLLHIMIKPVMIASIVVR
jgi:hypothetical protein